MAIPWQSKLSASVATAIVTLFLCLLGLEHPTFSLGAERASWAVPRPNATQQDIRYLRLSAAAMNVMMRNMQRSPSGDVDQDFVAQMIPHHEAAIQMAIAVLSSTHNAQLQRLAEEIVVTQRDEIRAMQLAVGESHLATTGRP